MSVRSDLLKSLHTARALTKPTPTVSSSSSVLPHVTPTLINQLGVCTVSTLHQFLHSAICVMSRRAVYNHVSHTHCWSYICRNQKSMVLKGEEPLSVRDWNQTKKDYCEL